MKIGWIVKIDTLNGARWLDANGNASAETREEAYVFEKKGDARWLMDHLWTSGELELA